MKAFQYRKQDDDKKRNVKDNISPQEILQFFNKPNNKKCYMCHSRFTENNKPTLDRINNDLPHTINNVEPCCVFCNAIKSNKDKDYSQYKIQ
jgi:hypothetical protein